MTKTRLVVGFYWLIAVLALIGTQSQNIHYFGGGGGPGAFGDFIIDAKANPAGRSVTIDLGLFFLAAAAFMLIEARRLGMRFVWFYILAGLFVAISVFFPLFLATREMKIAAAGAVGEVQGKPASILDSVIFIAVAALIFGLCWFVAAG